MDKEERKMKTEDFDNILMNILEGMQASELIHIAGIYEIVAEEFNNEVLRRYENTKNFRNATK